MDLTCHIDGNVERAELPHGLRHHTGHVKLRGCISREPYGLKAARAQKVGAFIGGLVAGIAYRNPRSFARKEMSYRPAYHSGRPRRRWQPFHQAVS